MKEELNEKQKLFCLEYLKDFNWTRAYQKIYWWSSDSARRQASRLLTKVHIQEYLWSKVEKKVEKLDVWVDYVLSWLREIAEIWMGRKEVEKNWKRQRILDLSNANSAYEKLWKYNKLFTDRVEQDGTLNINIVSYKKWQN
jgi:phage terminase small subunit